MNKTVKRLLFGLAIGAGIVALVLPKLPSGSEAPVEAGPPGGAAQALPVSAYVVEPVLLEDKILSTGTVLASEEVDLRPEIAGKVVEIFFREGSQVSAGEVLVKINDTELLAQYRRAEYRAKLAEDREFRQKQLLEKGGISREEYEETLNELNVFNAELDLITAQLEKTEIRAPFSGRIGLRYVSEGSYISPTSRIATLQKLDPVKVEFSVPEKYAPRVQVGDKITYAVQGLDGEFAGTIYAYEPKIDASTRTLRLRAESRNPRAQILPGAFANITLVFEQVADAIAIPSVAVVPELGGKKVFVFANGVVEARLVETGIRTDEHVQVVSGLAPRDTVITSGLQQLRPGLPVRLTGFAAQTTAAD
jgi:membrane fusion protein (multidrug efflux system)